MKTDAITIMRHFSSVWELVESLDPEKVISETPSGTAIALGINDRQVRTEYDIEAVIAFARRCPARVVWTAPEILAVQGMEYPSPCYNAGDQTITMFHPAYYSTDEALKHCLMHETAHHLHFHNGGFLARHDGHMYSKRQHQYWYNVAEIVAETATMIASRILGIIGVDKPLSNEACARYIATYRLGAGVWTTVPMVDLQATVAVAHHLVDIYGEIA